MQTVSKPLDPPLKWAGGKRLLVPTLKPYFNKFRDHRLVEPFCGGLAVALGLQPERALLNDLNPHLMNFYLWLQNGLEFEIEAKNEKEFYYAKRNEFNLLSIPLDNQSHSPLAAQLWWYLNHTGFNGLCRFNSTGGYNNAFGKFKTVNYQPDFAPYKLAFKNWQFLNTDFENLNTTDNDFIYADPPYDTPFTSYSQGGFDWRDQVRCAKWLAAKQCPVIASNQATDRIIKLYSELGFEIKFIDARRSISCNGDRAKAKEILAFKNLEVLE